MERSIKHLITKRFINTINKFNEDLKAFAKQTDEEEPTLYESAFISFTLSNVRVEDDCFCYRYNGGECRDIIAYWDEEEEDYYCYVDTITDDIKFWRGCLRRAKRYWGMSCEELDSMQDRVLNGKEEE